MRYVGIAVRILMEACCLAFACFFAVVQCFPSQCEVWDPNNLVTALPIVGLCFPKLAFFLFWAVAIVGAGLIFGRRIWNLFQFTYIGWSLILLVLLVLPQLFSRNLPPQAPAPVGAGWNAPTGTSPWEIAQAGGTAPPTQRPDPNIPAPRPLDRSDVFQPFKKDRTGSLAPPPMSEWKQPLDAPPKDVGAPPAPDGDKAPAREDVASSTPQANGGTLIPQTSAETMPWLVVFGMPAFTLVCVALILLRNNKIPWLLYRRRSACSNLVAELVASPTSRQALNCVPVEPGTTLPRLNWDGRTVTFAGRARDQEALLHLVATRLCELEIPNSSLGKRLVDGKPALVFRLEPGKHFMALFTAYTVGNVLTVRWGWYFRDFSDMPLFFPLSSAFSLIGEAGRNGGGAGALVFAPVFLPIVFPFAMLGLALARPSRAGAPCFWRYGYTDCHERHRAYKDQSQHLRESLGSLIEGQFQRALEDFPHSAPQPVLAGSRRGTNAHPDRLDY